MWALAASAGISALLVTSEPAFIALKLAGGAYLVYLGGQAPIAAAGRPPRVDPGAVAASGRELRQGMLSNLANPKMAVFFSSLLPQFVDSFLPLLGLSLLFCTLTMFWLSAYATALARVGDVFRGRRVRRAIDSATWTALVVLGVRLAGADR